MTFGGFPDVVNINIKRDYLSSLSNKIFLWDVILRNKITNPKALEVLVKKSAESVRQSISYTRLTNIVKSVVITISKPTVIQYMEYLKDSYLLFSIENYASTIAERTTNPKYYFENFGVLNLFLYDAKSALLENVLASALLRNYEIDNFYFYEDLKCELDFYVPSESLAIQVSYSIKDEKIKDEKLMLL